MPDFPELDWLTEELAALERQDRRRHLRVRESPHVAGRVQIDGRSLIDFSSNDYLGLSADGRLVQATHACVGQVGFGSGASPLITGYGVWHRRLEQELALLEGTEAALTLGSGYAANIAALTALAGPGDCIWSDALNHASIIDGCRLSGARIEVYRHQDLDHLQELTRRRDQFRRTVIVTDSLFSMDGDFARLPELVQIAQRSRSILMIDEAHATGVWGEQGRGVAELQEVDDQIPVRIGTFSKALGGIGGFIVGSQSLIDWIKNKARSYIFSTAFPEVAAAVAWEALKLVREEPERRRSLARQSQLVREALRAAGIPCGPSESQIIPILVGDSGRAVALSQALWQRGFLIPAIRPPSVPEGTARLRLSLTSAHTPEQLKGVVAAVREVVASDGLDLR